MATKLPRLFRFYLLPYLKLQLIPTFKQKNIKRLLLRKKLNKTDKHKRFLRRLLTRVVYKRLLKRDSIFHAKPANESDIWEARPSIGFQREGRLSRRGNRSGKKLRIMKIVDCKSNVKLGVGGIDLRFFVKLFKKLL